MTSEIYGQAHSTIEGQGTSGTLVIKPPKESYQLNQVQVVQSPKLQRLIDNEEPYLEETSHPPTQHKHSVIFEPIRHLQFSRSVYRLTSMINFEPHIYFFESYEHLLDEFLNDMTSQGVSDLISKPYSVGDRGGMHGLPEVLKEINCSDPSVCANQKNKACYQWFLSICMNQRHYNQMLEDVRYVKQVFLSIKGDFFDAINHVAVRTETDKYPEDGPNRKKRQTKPVTKDYRSTMTSKELQFVAETLEGWVNTTNSSTSREKRFGVDTLILGGGILANRHSIKTIQKNIKQIHEDNKRQDRQIKSLAKFVDKLFFRIRQHDTFLEKLDARVIKIEYDLLGLLELNHYNSYTTYTLRDANYILGRLITGLTAAQKNSENIYSFLRVTSTHKLDPTVIPIPQLKEILSEVEDEISESPRLALPIPVETEIEDYYNILRVSTVITEDALIILLSVPLTDVSLQMNLYKAHNLPAVHPTLNYSATYLLEGEYLAIGQDGHYVALPDSNDVQICVLSRGGLCRINQALYPIDKVQWCILALFQDNEENISKYCKFDLNQRIGNLAHSLGGYLWAISATITVKLQVRCLKRTYIVIIGPPLQIVFIGDGCEAYSPGIFISAKTELTSVSDKPGRQTFFIGFNGLYQANPFLGIWSKMDIDFISEEEAKTLAIEFPKLEQLDMEQFKQTIGKLHEDTFQMPSFLILGVMIVSVVVILSTIVIFVWKMYQVRGTLSKLKDVPNLLKSEPNVSGIKKASTRVKEVVLDMSKSEEGPSKKIGKTQGDLLEKALEVELKRDPRLIRKYFKSLKRRNVQMDTIPETDSEMSA